MFQIICMSYQKSTITKFKALESKGSDDDYFITNGFICIWLAMSSHFVLVRRKQVAYSSTRNNEYVYLNSNSNLPGSSLKVPVGGGWVITFGQSLALAKPNKTNDMHHIFFPRRETNDKSESFPPELVNLLNSTYLHLFFYG